MTRMSCDAVVSNSRLSPRLARGCAVLLLGAVATLGLPGGFAAGPREPQVVAGLNQDEVVRQALDKRDDWSFRDKPFREVIQEIRNRTKLNIVVDAFGLERAGIDDDTTLNIDLTGIRLQSALSAIVRPYSLTWHLDDGVIWITAREYPVDGDRATVVYRGADVLAQAPDQAPNPAALAKLNHAVINLIAPDSWTEAGNGGGSTARVVGNSLVVTQSRYVQQQVGQLLALAQRLQQAKVLRAAGKSTDTPRTLSTRSLTPSTREQQMRTRMREATTVDFDAVPLRDALAYLSKQHALSFVVDIASTYETNVDDDSTLTCKLENIPLETALRSILGPLELDWVIADEVVYITAPAYSDIANELQVYDLSDLVARLPTPGEDEPDKLEQLEATLVAAVDATTWEQAGGRGRHAWLGDSLWAVSHHPRAQRAIESLVDQLRTANLPLAGEPVPTEPAGERWVVQYYSLPELIDASWLDDDTLSEIAQELANIDADSEEKLSATTKLSHLRLLAEITQQQQKQRNEHYLRIAGELVQTLPSLVEPDSWLDGKGRGKIHAVGATLVVRQTTVNHAKIKKLLSKLNPESVQPHASNLNCQGFF